MKFRSGEDLVRKLQRSRSRAMAPRGAQVAQRGRQYARECPNRRCGQRGRTIDQADGSGELVKRCARCGTPWPFKDIYTLAGQSHAGKGGRPPRSVLEAGDYAPFEHRLLQAGILEPGHARVALMYLHPTSGFSMRGLADALTEQNFLGQRWQTKDVRRAVERATSCLERDMARRGILDR